jgi:ParB family chromosome partitioning protein
MPFSIRPFRRFPVQSSVTYDDAQDRMTNVAEKFNPEKIKLNDLAKTGGAPDEGE